MTRVNSLRGNSFKEQHQRAKKCSEREEQKKPPCDTEYVNVMKIKCRKNHKNNSKKNARCRRQSLDMQSTVVRTTNYECEKKSTRKTGTQQIFKRKYDRETMVEKILNETAYRTHENVNGK